jgi:hypothetical protein
MIKGLYKQWNYNQFVPEIINMCDRAYVVCKGRISGHLERSEFSQEKIMTCAVVALAGTLAAGFITNQHLDVTSAIVLALVIGTAIGL